MAGATYLYGGNCYFKEHLDYFNAWHPDGYLPRLTDNSKDKEVNIGYNTTRYLLNAAYMLSEELDSLFILSNHNWWKRLA